MIIVVTIRSIDYEVMISQTYGTYQMKIVWYCLLNFKALQKKVETYFVLGRIWNPKTRNQYQPYLFILYLL